MIAEVFTERAAICEFCGGMSREDAEAMARAEAEKLCFERDVRAVLAMPFESRRGYLYDVERTRGKVAGDALRAAVQAEWLRRKAAA